MKKQYIIFEIPKSNGKTRRIEAPCPELKEAQRNCLWRLTKTYPVSPFATGFVSARNIAHNALLHSNQTWVACMDVSNFFPSITWDKFIKEVHLHKEDVKKIKELNFYDFNDGYGLRLPQGAPCSPFLSNLYMMRFDWRMASIAEKLNITYSRYADDLVFSGDVRKNVQACLKIAEEILHTKLQLQVNQAKTKLRHRTQKQLVTGLVVNCRANVPRRERKRLRAALHQARKAGKKLSARDQGRLAFLHMVQRAVRPASNLDLIGSRRAMAKL